MSGKYPSFNRDWPGLFRRGGGGGGGVCVCMCVCVCVWRGVMRKGIPVINPEPVKP